MREAAQELDRIDKLEPGRGQLDAFGFAVGDLDSGRIGVGVEYGHRITERLSAIARGTAGYSYGAERGFDYDAVIAGRWVF